MDDKRQFFIGARSEARPTSSTSAEILAVRKEIPYHHAILPVLRIKITMITSKLTTKAQTTIPQPVRVALRLQPGDELVYEIDDQRVIVTKASHGTHTDDPFRTFREWNSAADTKAYGKL